MQRNDRTYNNAFPGVHLRYEVPHVRGFLARLSYSEGITRPNYEVAYNQQLGGLAAWLTGFSAYASYVHTVADGELQGVIPEVFKVGVAYERNRILARLHYNANSRQQTNFSSNAFLNRYLESEPDLEMNLRYSFSPRYSVFVDVANLLDTAIVERQGDPDDPAVGYRHFRYAELGRKISFGLRGRF